MNSGAGCRMKNNEQKFCSLDTRHRKGKSALILFFLSILFTFSASATRLLDFDLNSVPSKESKIDQTHSIQSDCRLNNSKQGRQQQQEQQTDDNSEREILIRAGQLAVLLSPSGAGVAPDPNFLTATAARISSASVTCSLTLLFELNL